MKYSVLITCALHGALTPFEFSAKTDDEAVELARKKHQVPDEGGDYTVDVTCLDVSQVFDPRTKSMVSREAGFVVSSFGVAHEPKPHVAEAVYAAREAKQKAAEAAEHAKSIEMEFMAKHGLALDASGNVVKK